MEERADLDRESVSPHIPGSHGHSLVRQASIATTKKKKKLFLYEGQGEPGISLCHYSFTFGDSSVDGKRITHDVNRISHLTSLLSVPEDR